MEEMRIYIANLGKYNEGELVGAWFTPPVDFEEVKERIGLNDEYEEYANKFGKFPLKSEVQSNHHDCQQHKGLGVG